MNSTEDVEAAAHRLANFRKDDLLEKILKDHERILREYTRLLNDHDDLRESRDRYKVLAKAQERNPFVVVLVDGDGYVFDQSFLSDGADGGSRAAQSLVEAIKASLRDKGLESCNIVLRIYANLAGLSKTLSRAGLATNDKRSVAPFVAGFNRSWGLGDFVDAGEVKENADFKLRACLQLYAGDAQCKHIYFAACHDSGYVSELKPYSGNRDRFTLVNIPSIAFHPEFTKLGMNVERIDGVFRPTPLLVEPIPRQPSRVAWVPPTSQLRYQSPRYDNRMPMRTESGKPNGSRLIEAPEECNTAQSLQNRLENLFKTLPKKGEVLGCIAVNRNNFRLDPHTPSPSREAFQAFTKRNRVCNKFHLTKSCKAGEKCQYSHDKLDEENLEVLEYHARQIPCKQSGACRDTVCCSGHICQNINCKLRGGNSFCKIPRKGHEQNMVVAQYVTADTKLLDGEQASSVGSYNSENDDGPNGQGAGLLPEVGNSLEDMDANA